MGNIFGSDRDDEIWRLSNEVQREKESVLKLASRCENKEALLKNIMNENNELRFENQKKQIELNIKQTENEKLKYMLSCYKNIMSDDTVNVLIDDFMKSDLNANFMDDEVERVYVKNMIEWIFSKLNAIISFDVKAHESGPSESDSVSSTDHVEDATDSEDDGGSANILDPNKDNTTDIKSKTTEHDDISDKKKRWVDDIVNTL